MPKPTVGRIVHYVSHGTPVRQDGSQAFTSECRAAIITEVQSRIVGDRAVIDVERVGLAVLNPTGVFLHSIAAGGCAYHDGAEQPGLPDCPNAEGHGSPFRYCTCGWIEASFQGGTWHWPERVED